MEAYERYGRALVRRAARILGNQEDALDLVQGLFTDLHGRGDHHPDLAYLYRAITNRCLTFLRDETNRARLLERHDVALLPSARERGDERSIGLDLLSKLVRELDRDECEVLTYRYLDDMTQDEIAHLLGVSRKTVGKRLDRVRDVVRRIVDRGGGGGAER